MHNSRSVIDIDSNISAIDTLIHNITEKSDVSFSTVLNRLREKRKESALLQFPISILKHHDLGIQQSLVKYLKEELSLSFHNIALLLNRDERCIWTTYSQSKTRHPEKLIYTRQCQFIPISIFSDRKLSMLENLTIYLREVLNLKNRHISELLQRDNRTIWTCYERAKKKKAGKNHAKR